ncbi:MAG TPA: hypothetical protein VKE98_23325 [Gemmataceae bacterium]|nr:hypothetical protein [Gemmataceae bacterium]
MKFRWRRIVIGLITVVVVSLAIPVGKELIDRSKAREDLNRIISELDRTDPRWRLEDVELDRHAVPDESNSAVTVTAAHRLLPKKWEPKIDAELEKIPPPIALRKDQADKLAGELKSLEDALQTARKLKDQPIGSTKLNYTPDFLSTLVPHLQPPREVASLLVMDVTLSLDRKDMEKAWISNRALLNTGRSIGDEPLLISILVRFAIDELAVRNLERALGQGEFKETHLEERQRAFGTEMEVPHFLIGMRGERAGTDHMLSNIENGTISLLRTLNNVGKKKKSDSSSIWDQINEFLAFSMVLRSHATLLDLQTRLIEAIKLAPKERNQAVKEVEAAFKQIAPDDKSQILVRLLFPSVTKMAQAEQRIHTKLACAIAGIGAERFRLKKNRWPDSLEELVQAGCLKEIPIDLFDGNPLRFRRTNDGLVIYSPGLGGFYDGKALDDLGNVNENVIRVEFRLWDPSQRRQTPLPPKGDKQ